MAVAAVAARLVLIAPGGALADGPSTDEDKQPATQAEPVAVIELRPGDSSELRRSRDEFARALAGVNGMAPITESGLATALTGERLGRAHADQALDRARTAYGEVDCAAAATAANTAIDAYAALQAQADDVAAPLRRAYVYLLLCANNRGEIDSARRAASHLRRMFGDTAPTGVSATIWDRYPTIDAASNVDQVELTITTSGGAATVWIDHTAIGTAPVTTVVTAGEHLVAVANSTSSTSRRVDVTESASIAIDLVTADSRWAHVRRQVAGWRLGDTPADAIALGQLLNRAGVRFAIVLAGKSQAEVWALPSDNQAARRLTVNTMVATFELGATIVEQVEAWEGPDPTALVGPTKITHSSPVKKPQKWWVYASILGAVLVGTGAILAADLADDHQRIELTWP